MNITGLSTLPTIRRLADGQLFVFPAAYGLLGNRRPAEQARLALAGPFPSRAACGAWIIEHLEQQLTAPQVALWQRALDRAGGALAEYGQLIYLLGIVLMDKPADYVLRCAGRA